MKLVARNAARRNRQSGSHSTLNAESYCERVLRCAGHVLTESNTLLSDDELEILRMNRDFMSFMREHYPELVKEHFKGTVIDQEAGDDVDESSDESDEGE